LPSQIAGIRSRRGNSGSPRRDDTPGLQACYLARYAIWDRGTHRRSRWSNGGLYRPPMTAGSAGGGHRSESTPDGGSPPVHHAWPPADSGGGSNMSMTAGRSAYGKGTVDRTTRHL